ncbi:hypothetical protein L21SP2_0762 [Salinispira pacifica]|uniref:Uncharacterized protein n=1 Tax=Salinispira pacifica TaxID=1307761 RepID=V5WEF1_9SPIO|nr:hypothetical protein L21SP2_0762 [Salinispira pacifica]
MAIAGMKKRKFDLFNIVNISIMLIICGVTIYPIWYTVVLSFNDGSDALLGASTGGPGSSVWRAIRRYSSLRILYGPS